MIRTIIHIDTDKCTGCGLCAAACHEGAIDMVNGKAHLARENFCDGFGDCLPACPAGAITFEEREAPAYDEKAVMEAKKQSSQPAVTLSLTPSPVLSSALTNWPVQIRLAPLVSPALQNASLLIAADCTAYAYASFHEDFIRGRKTLIGCPKLDNVDYSIKLTEMLRNNAITDVTVVRMEVPCCSALANAAKKALSQCGKDLPLTVITIRNDGSVAG